MKHARRYELAKIERGERTVEEQRAMNAARKRRQRCGALAPRVKQIGECHLCGRLAPLLFDHDHCTGAFRGWLCAACNSGLGMLGDDVEGLRRAIDYLQRPKQGNSGAGDAGRLHPGFHNTARRD